MLKQQKVSHLQESLHLYPHTHFPIQNVPYTWVCITWSVSVAACAILLAGGSCCKVRRFFYAPLHCNARFTICHIAPSRGAALPHREDRYLDGMVRQGNAMYCELSLRSCVKLTRGSTNGTATLWSTSVCINTSCFCLVPCTNTSPQSTGTFCALQITMCMHTHIQGVQGSVQLMLQLCIFGFHDPMGFKLLMERL